MPNRLADETSPYLLQHKDNPVDWFPWGQEALDKAKHEDKPIFLSVGYSACHWCHVMEHESFEDEATAKLLNADFVCIKVDREERPDLDQIYMNAVQLMTQHGGWPMSVFLTPDLKPFFGGTYWPPEPRIGMPGFKQVIAGVLEAWQNKRDAAIAQADEVTKYLQPSVAADPADAQLTKDTLLTAATKLERAFDFTHGGFGRAPKFPHPMDVQLLLRVWHRWPRDGVLDMVKLTLDKMARGGIYDHLAGGFARYSVDERWLVPHFEKMLYDNALLAGAYLDGYLATGDPFYAQVVRETADYILTYMTDDGGAFHSTEDADSEGEEGKFYVWTPDEIAEVLGNDGAERFCYIYDVTEEGNFEGRNILNLPKTIEQCAALRGWDAQPLRAELAESRAKLLSVRDGRVRPGKDDKVLVSWNALMIDSLARAAGVFGEPKYLQAAARAADFLLAAMRRDDGRLLHSWRHGQAKFDAYLDDYAYLANALVSLYEVTFDERWLDESMRLADVMMAHFRDTQAGGFFFTADDHEQLIARNKDMQDSSVPSGSSMAATALLRLGKLCGRNAFLDAARETITGAATMIERAPTATGQMIVALDMLIGPTPEIAIVGDMDTTATREAITNLRARYLPNRVVACRSNDRVGHGGALQPMFAGKQSQHAEPTVFVCENFACQTPRSGKEALIQCWDACEQMGRETER